MSGDRPQGSGGSSRRFCRHCGEQVIAPTARFCRKCGRPFAQSPGKPLRSRRRRLLAGVVGICAIAALVAGILVARPHGRRPARAPVDDITPNGCAISLRAFQDRLRECAGPEAYPDDLLHLCGMTQIAGYLLDRENHDIVIFGPADPTQPPLHLEDFVVALRNVHDRYAQTGDDGTIHHEAPGCSIDPDPAVIYRLRRVMREANRAHRPRDRERLLEQWRQIGQAPQHVRILGVPHESRFAKIAVEADYYLKRVSNGTAELALDGFKSLTERRLQVLREGPARHASEVPSLYLSRFWFAAGVTTYLEDQDVILLDACPVDLLTEEEFLNAQREIAGRGRSDPVAAAFAQDFTTRYQEIARLRPIYAELEGLFRAVALARLLKTTQAPSVAPLSLGYLLQQHLLPTTSVSRCLPGITHIRTETREERSARRIIWLSSCGGVDMDIHSRPRAASRQDRKRVMRLRAQVLKSRPSRGAVAWGFSAEEAIRVCRTPKRASGGVPGGHG